MPITVTLEFATEAALLAYFSGKPLTSEANAQTIKDAVVMAPAKPKSEVKAEPKKVEPVATVVAQSEAKTDYPTLQKAVFKLAAISREATTELLTKLGAKTFKELDPSRWDEALAAVLAKTEELSEAVA